MDRDASPEQDLQALKQAFDIFHGGYRGSWAVRGVTSSSRSRNCRSQLHTAQDERRQEAERNKRLAERLGTVIETLPGGLVVLDAMQSGVNEVNSAAREHVR